MPDTPTNWNGAYSGAQIDSLLAKANTAANQADVTALLNRVSSLESRMTAAENVNTQQNTDIAAKLNISDVPAMTKDEYDALVTKTAKYYFTYEDTTTPSNTSNTNNVSPLSLNQANLASVGAITNDDPALNTDSEVDVTPIDGGDT